MTDNHYNSAIQSMTLEPGLYVAATPIGNLKDITIRVIESLQGADLILCEDTRQTAKLCQAYGISTPRQAYHDHNGAKVRPEILRQLQEGAAICLVSDAGTPLISDPGYKLVREVREVGINVTPLPGPSAAIAALSVAGIASDRFMFAGFLPAKPLARDRALQELAAINATLIFYEAAERVEETLNAMANSLGARDVVVARELTKKFETVVSGMLTALPAIIDQLTRKGEFVILVDPPKKNHPRAHIKLDSILMRLAPQLGVKEAATIAAELLEMPRRQAYNRALELQKTIPNSSE